MQRADQRVRRDDAGAGLPSVQGMVLFVLMASLPVFSAGRTWSHGDAVRVQAIAGPSYSSFFIENRRAYDVTVTLRIRGPNTRVTRIVPETATCGGHQRIEAARVSAADPNKPCRWHYSFHWAKGRMDVRHDDQTRYRLPFRKGESHPVCQGYNGRWSHRDQDRYAVDFAMPEGTTVCAAREGIVVDLQESWKVGGPDKKYKDQCNFVSIAHADGTIGEYCHLQYEGALVEIGDRITAGRPIALSGNTGYSALPHVHFGVYSAADGIRRQSHRLTFVTREGIVAEPVVGKTYTAQ
jgi:murein DD-endopeptidase MepM/ murein hydrolase activator NlpD